MTSLEELDSDTLCLELDSGSDTLRLELDSESDTLCLDSDSDTLRLEADSGSDTLCLELGSDTLRLEFEPDTLRLELDSDSDVLCLEPDSEDSELRDSERSDMLSGCGDVSVELGGVLELLRRPEPPDLPFLEKNHRPEKVDPERFLEEDDIPLAISSASAMVRERELFSVLRLLVAAALVEEVRGERCWFLTLTVGR